MSRSEPDHYRRLGVAPTASAGQLRDAYRQRARQLHPDTATGDAEAMAALNESWRVLSDPARRARYDAEQRADRTAPARAAPVHGPADDVDDVDDVPLSPGEMRTATWFGRTLAITLVVVAVALVVLFAYAFIRSGTLRSEVP